MNVIQGTNLVGRQCVVLLDYAVNIIVYKRSIIGHAIYVKLFSNGTISFLTVLIDAFLGTTNNYEGFW